MSRLSLTAHCLRLTLHCSPQPESGYQQQERGRANPKQAVSRRNPHLPQGNSRRRKEDTAHQKLGKAAGIADGKGIIIRATAGDNTG